MQFIDTHTHLYSEQYNEDRTKAIQKAIELGLDKFFLPNIDSSSIEGMHALQTEFPNHCYPMMGLHPCSVDKNFEKELLLMESKLAEYKYIAIGEIGIDLYWDKTFLAQQEIAFRTQINWAKERKLPIVIHCRDAFNEILSILDEVNDDKLFGVFHCFTGTIEQAKHILNYGKFKLGIGGVVTFKNSGLDRVVQQLELKDLVLETDSPYLAPIPYRGKRNESAYLIHIAEKLADLYQVPIEEIAEKTSQNALEIFNIA
ncbi:MAG: TatD family hydrolase [Flavobacteriales bacterium]|nr:TatD family hydrolase [Flavobacteriales bacterium]